MSFALDVNILLYASDRESPFHKRSTEFLQRQVSASEILYLPWPTIMSYLRMSTHPSICRQPLSPHQATANIDALIRLPHVRTLAEDEGFWEVYRDIVGAGSVRGNLVPDAHLAALLKQHGVRTLYTHDLDFRRFPFLAIVDPLAPDARS